MKKILLYLGGIVSGAGLLFGMTVYANPTLLTSTAQSSSATTTLAYMTPGTATTTVTYDVWAENGTNQTNDGNRLYPDYADLSLYMKASSTLSILVTNVEYSEDKLDWYQNNLETYAAGAIAVATPNSYTWTFATSTIGGLLNGIGTDVGAKIIRVKAPMRYVRAVVSLTGANAGVRAKFLPKKQISYSY